MSCGQVRCKGETGTSMQSPLSPEGGTAAAAGRTRPAGYASANPATVALTRQAVRDRRTRIVLAALSLAGIAISMALIGAVALLGPSAAVPRLPSAFPW